MMKIRNLERFRLFFRIRFRFSSAGSDSGSGTLRASGLDGINATSSGETREKGNKEGGFPFF